jgi:hypothetical protein
MVGRRHLGMGAVVGGMIRILVKRELLLTGWGV